MLLYSTYLSHVKCKLLENVTLMLDYNTVSNIFAARYMKSILYIHCMPDTNRSIHEIESKVNRFDRFEPLCTV
jgi:hypothetical protein